MKQNSNDKTLERQYKYKWKQLISEYEDIKAGRHTRYRFVGEFFKTHSISRQKFNKLYRRFSGSGDEEDLLPHKRGPKWVSRRPEAAIEKEVIEERKRGLNKYEICDILTRRHGRSVTSPSGVYNIIKREGMNIIRAEQKEIKRKIIKERPGELGHIDCHYISKDLLPGSKKQFYIVGIVDSCSRIASAEVLEDIKSLTVMFATMRLFNNLKKSYGIQFERILSDNGAEFASPKNVDKHPFERMLVEIGVRHSYTRPYRPQTNGKVERFWRTLKDDLLESGGFESLEVLMDNLFEYLVYYNEIRPHQSLNGKTPLAFLQNLSTN